ncbi:hypothetical protein [Streptomyces flaveus]|uniref:Secreted protein n=1 Tax=Streptomyces flaveus TaxID=66370 RepID=A0A917VCU7_9ACTN|nr:hypothetical protein [Streptomyces flaveus]GGK63557.1 hypothetical protein GCM10010094_25490 [Streptomyces flaveus]
MKKLVGRLGMVTALAAVPLVLGTGTAHAAITTVRQGDDYARYWHSSQNLYACDEEGDGNGVYAEYWGSGSKHGEVSDGNGSKDGCGWADVGAISSFRVCEDTSFGNVCSSRVYI